jgi:3-deoxy-manno-octulosonate cytidylyltransferase (CMP-KDO synthetase)
LANRIHRAVQNGRIIAVIPARLGSERLARKPLLPLAGRPLVEWVWRRVSSFSGIDAVVVATDAAEVVALCQDIGARALLTSPEHASGTERVAEVAARPEFADAEVIVNVQGDEPFVTAEHVAGAVTALRAGFDIGTVAAPLGTLAAWRDPAVVKVVRRADGAALYFSRAPIPHARGREPTAAELAGPPFLRHIGIYAFSPGALRRWTGLGSEPLEAVERLEQLRPLAAGLTIGVGLVAAAEGGVDTPDDARRAEVRLRAQDAHPTTTR